MGQPVKLSDELVCNARLTAALTDRSIAGQIEFWAQLGRSLEPLLRGDRVLALRQANAGLPLSEALRNVDSDDGRERVRAHLNKRPFPHFEAVPGSPGLLRRVDEDGTQTVGKFVNRVFERVEL